MSKMPEGKIVCKITATSWGQIAYGEAGQEVQFYWPVYDLAAELHQAIKNIAEEEYPRNDVDPYVYAS